ncbi:unnamed protein product [Caenorhabditis sp. 36 PRJEB53466]|nr:unnamed protein product [Caenorhabditis sp. 36 PRJEB53466]
MMAVDLFLAVIMPIRHKFWQRGPYLFALCVPPVAFSAFAVAIEKLYVNHDYLLFCTVSLAVPTTVRFWGTLITFSTVLLAVILILITALKVHLNEKTASPFLRHQSNMTIKPKCSEVRLLKSLSTLIFVFICSWSLSLVIFHVSLYFDSKVTYQVHKYTFLLQLPTFCQNFFVTALRSPRYRRAYVEQMKFLSCVDSTNSRCREINIKKLNPIVEVRRFNSLPPGFL